MDASMNINIIEVENGITQVVLDGRLDIGGA
jgi:hypothetical protein